MSLSETRESDVLQSLLPQYQAEGFEVYVNPSPSILPSFMKGYRPDAIALRSDKKIAIEVVSSREGSSQKTRQLQSLLSDHKDWELRVFYVSSLNNERSLEIASSAAVSESIQRVLRLKEDGHSIPALIMAWATLEAIGRSLLPVKLGRPQTPARLIEVLATEGYITPSEADYLRKMISLRNAAVHGGFAPDVSNEQLERFVVVLKTLAANISHSA